MITVSAGYLSGDRDNHANGLKIAVCSLLQNIAERHGLPVERRVLPYSGAVTYVVTLSSCQYANFHAECIQRGLVTGLLHTAQISEVSDGSANPQATSD